MADFFGSENIIVHPPRTHDVKTLQENLAKLGDKRIILESMPGLDIDHQVMQCGQTLEDLKEISKQNGICFDLAKSFKASRHQKLDYQEFVTEALKEIKPKYFHISGGNDDTPVDQHLNMWKAAYDVGWVREALEEYAKDFVIHLAFETPKAGDDLTNDVKNVEFFKQS